MIFNQREIKPATFGFKKLIGYTLGFRNPSKSWMAWIFICTAITVLLCVIFVNNFVDNVWTAWIDPIIGVTLIFGPLMIWFYTNREDWAHQLPKRLTVHFIYEGKPLFSCFEAYLSGESDIRQWAQQIGSQWSGSRNLQFDPFIFQERPDIMREKHTDGEWQSYKLYTLVIKLQEMPPAHNAGGNSTLTTIQQQLNLQLAKNGYTIWQGVPSDLGRKREEYCFAKNVPLYTGKDELVEWVMARKEEENIFADL